MNGMKQCAFSIDILPRLQFNVIIFKEKQKRAHNLTRYHLTFG